MLIFFLCVLASLVCYRVAKSKHEALGEYPPNPISKKGIEYKRRLQNEVLPWRYGLYGSLIGALSSVFLMITGAVPVG